MEINFGTNVTNCAVIFNYNANANYGYGNRNMWIHGNNWNGQVAFPYGTTSGRVNASGILNKKVVIPNSVTIAEGMFHSCSNLNQNIQIPNSVTKTANMFYSCSNLNQNIQIPNSVTNAVSMFYSCYNLNQNIQIPNSVTNAWFMFRKCNSIHDIVVGPNVANSIFVGIFEQNNAHAKNIHTDTLSAANLITTNIIANAGTNLKLAGQILPTWTTITNGYYNALYNVYIYTNAVV